ncbi:uncharacterized protein LOC143017909 isoform X2 [Oratosquilla oratoria]|uniref:uncharacterized protein LOC143017909 isoform X2 n=1 Tax=Oratosquilla oratoria TaxID=337810 RepID=UPI003F759CCE
MEGKANFVSSYYKGEEEEAVAYPPEEYPEYTEYSSHYDDIKLPGRFYPRLPYQKPYREDPDYPDPFEPSTTFSNTGTGGIQFHAPPPPTPSPEPSGPHFAARIDSGDYRDSPQGDTPQGGAAINSILGAMPTFDNSMPHNITVAEGKTAYMSCRVYNIGHHSVSWIRHRDLHILTVHNYRYSSDSRVSAIYNEVTQEWMVKIRGVTQADAGRYECQVSTKPIRSYVVNMKVVVPVAEILNPPDVFVHRGSLINLTCIVSHGTARPVYIYWYHHDKMVDYEGARGGITVATEAGRNTVSHLMISGALSKDSGKYTCRPSNGGDASVRVHVLNGEYQAAMQTNRGWRFFTSWVLPSTTAILSLALSSSFLLGGLGGLGVLGIGAAPTHSPF